MRTFLLSTIFLLGSCTFFTQNLVVERCGFDDIRCADDQTQLECIDGVEALIDCDNNLICAPGIGCSACGNNEINAGEECDGDDLPANDCEDFNSNFNQGALVCNPDCTLNTDECSFCGDDRTEGNEQCDADSLSDGCVPDVCVLATTPCNGDGSQQGFELCDGDDLGGQSCTGLGFARGDLQCRRVNGLCSFNVDNCERF